MSVVFCFYILKWFFGEEKLIEQIWRKKKRLCWKCENVCFSVWMCINVWHTCAYDCYKPDKRRHILHESRPINRRLFNYIQWAAKTNDGNYLSVKLLKPLKYTFLVYIHLEFSYKGKRFTFGTIFNLDAI